MLLVDLKIGAYIIDVLNTLSLSVSLCLTERNFSFSFILNKTVVNPYGYPRWYWVTAVCCWCMIPGKPLFCSRMNLVLVDLSDNLGDPPPMNPPLPGGLIRQGNEFSLNF